MAPSPFWWNQWLSMEHHERVGINALPHRQSCFFSIKGAHTYNRSPRWPGFALRSSRLQRGIVPERLEHASLRLKIPGSKHSLCMEFFKNYPCSSSGKWVPGSLPSWGRWKMGRKRSGAPPQLQLPGTGWLLGKTSYLAVANPALYCWLVRLSYITWAYSVWLVSLAITSTITSNLEQQKYVIICISGVAGGAVAKSVGLATVQTLGSNPVHGRPPVACECEY